MPCPWPPPPRRRPGGGFGGTAQERDVQLARDGCRVDAEGRARSCWYRINAWAGSPAASCARVSGPLR
ncbi:MAG TPA: hypothetical protein VFC00_24195 [Micromonosporaceae bacterium]|nr:hypothetical protein [Micromonosporaceae bacterium]